MSQFKAKLPTDNWVVATWDEYIQMIEEPAYKRARGYYRNRQMRIEIIGDNDSRRITQSQVLPGL